MAAVGEIEGSEDVNDFLARIRELGDKRDKEDEERTRKLEEEILQGRKERAARRAERARSISPIKVSPMSYTSSNVNSATGTPIQARSPQLIASILQTPDSTVMSQEDPVEKPNDAYGRSLVSEAAVPKVELSRPLPPISASVSRSGTLSWQQRPSSTGLRSRPLSMVAAENNAARSPRSTSEPRFADDKRHMVNDKVEPLASEGASLLRQTTDRGLAPAAYRMAHDYAAIDQESTPASTHLLPISTEAGGPPERPSSWTVNTSEATSSSQDEAPQFSDRQGQRTLNVASQSSSRRVGSPMPTLGSHVLEPPMSGKNFGSSEEPAILRALTLSSAHGRTSSERIERPISPTKGLGGFVQSAMMKRSDSVNKRWSAQASPGLSRGSSVASNRGSHDTTMNTISSTGPGAGETRSYESSPISTPRPESRTSELRHKPSASMSEAHNFERLSLQHRPRARSRDSQHSHGNSPPVSPGKAPDGRRWNPSRASWLENAINRPDSPNLKPAQLHQPAWMVDLNKAKQYRETGEIGKSPGFEPVTVGGLLRSPAMGTIMKLPNLGGLAGVPPLPGNKPERFTSMTGSSTDAEPITTSSSPMISGNNGARLSPESASVGGAKPLEHNPKASSVHASNDTGFVPGRTARDQTDIPETEKTLSSMNEPLNSPLIPNPKPDTPPKKDFRSTLKARPAADEREQCDQPEFKSVFGNLKRAETKNYVAPDELKANILRGKAGLAVTGGPKPSERRDEFKESILKKKEEMMASASLPSPGVQKPSPAVPEALMIRSGMLAKSASVKGVQRGSISEIKTTVVDLQPLERMRTVDGASIRDADLPTPVKKLSAPARISQGPSTGGGKLAERFNPSLAGMLARGPPASATGVIHTPRIASPPGQSDSNRGAAGEGFELIHTTKSRARGPKRRPPTASPYAVERNTPLSSITSTSNNTRMPATTPDAATKPQPRRIVSSPSSPKRPPPPIKPKRTVSEAKLKGQDDELKTAMVSSPAPLTASPKSPPMPAKKPDSIARVVSASLLTVSQAHPKMEVRADAAEPTEAAWLLKSFFGDLTSSSNKVNVDTQAVLAANLVAPDGKIKTLRKQMWEVTGDGKKIPVPAQQEHILFEGSMYICIHVFGSLSSGKRTTEVYLWCGDSVAPSAVEDAQLFGRNAAKEAGGKLIVLNQGKETSNFLEALGGIMITRRGRASGGRTITYIICGRRFMGQIAFDEVDYSPHSLCSGFPYIVAATGGSVYLWKGQGSGADELGCARLIGMDLGATGEIEEIDEGNEPPSFWSALNGSVGPPSKDGHWHLKASLSEKYHTRLFAIEDARPKSTGSGYLSWGRTQRDAAVAVEIREIMPFTQKDLTQDGIYVLDAFFEMYLIVCAEANRRLPAFHRALLFAQEYGILAASSQDRPFVPVCRIVLAGAPPGMKTAFRKWDSRQATTLSSAEAQLVDLNAALQAIGRA